MLSGQYYLRLVTTMQAMMLLQGAASPVSSGTMAASAFGVSVQSGAHAKKSHASRKVSSLARYTHVRFLVHVR